MIEKAKITKIGIVKDGTAIGWGFDAEGKNNYHGTYKSREEAMKVRNEIARLHP